MYERIDKRVDLMLDTGLLKEAETYLGNMGSTAVQAIGYKELKPYLSGEASPFADESIPSTLSCASARSLLIFSLASATILSASF